VCPQDPQRDSGDDDQRLPDEDVGIVEVLGQKNADVEERYDAHQIYELDREQAADDADELGGDFGRERKHPGYENQAGDQSVTPVVYGDCKTGGRYNAAGDGRLFTKDTEDETRHSSDDGRVGRNENVVDLPQGDNGEAHTEDRQEQDEKTGFRLLPQFAYVHTSQTEFGSAWEVNDTKPPGQRTAHRYLRSGLQGPFQGSAG